MSNKTLLAVGDQDETRLSELVDTAASFAAPDGEVVVLHAFDRDRYEEITSQFSISRDSEIKPDDIARKHRSTTMAVDRLEDDGLDVSTRGTLGDVSDAVLRVSREEDVDLVVVGGQKRSPSGKALFGSTAQQIMLGSDVPVTFVKGKASSESDPIESTA